MVVLSSLGTVLDQGPRTLDILDVVLKLRFGPGQLVPATLQNPGKMAQTCIARIEPHHL